MALEDVQGRQECSQLQHRSTAISSAVGLRGLPAVFARTIVVRIAAVPRSSGPLARGRNGRATMEKRRKVYPAIH